jgi:hypothetical protein
MEQMDPICKTVESADGMIKTRSAEEDQEKRKRETVSIDQELLLKPNQLISHLHFLNAMPCSSQKREDMLAEKVDCPLTKLIQLTTHLHFHNAMLCSSRKREVMPAEKEPFHLLKSPISHLHFLSATQCLSQKKEVMPVEKEPCHFLKILKDPHSHNVMVSTNQKMLVLHAETLF